jgi:hypothetical protein
MSCTALEEIDLPVCIVIGRYTFGSCTSLVSVNAPACQALYSYAFNACTNLKNINLPECNWMSFNAFSGCKALTEIVLPKCSAIHTSAFQQCTSLTNVYLGKNCSFSVGLAKFSARAFSSCYNLMKLVLYYSNLATLENVNTFSYTPIADSSYTGAFGSIYVPASLVDAYKSATNWATYADRITAIVE